VETKTNILIVNDSEFVRSCYTWILEQAYFHAITTVDGSGELEELHA
jgi:hypothetical protein